MYQRISNQIGGVLLEMTLSVTALLLLFVGIMDVSEKISRQNNLNIIGQELETILRGASINSGLNLEDTNRDIRAIHSDLNIALQRLFNKYAEDISRYQIRAGIFVYNMPESEQPVFYLWTGMLGTDNTYLRAKPCTKLMVPLDLTYEPSYFVGQPASADPDIIIFEAAQAQAKIVNNEDPYTFYEITNDYVAEVIDEFC